MNEIRAAEIDGVELPGLDLLTDPRDRVAEEHCGLPGRVQMNFRLIPECHCHPSRGRDRNSFVLIRLPVSHYFFFRMKKLRTL